MNLTDLGLKLINWKQLVEDENIGQLEKWGAQTRSSFEWLAYITEELGELSEAISENCYRGGLCEPVIKEAVQVATLALKVAEMYQDKLISRVE